MSFAYSVAIKLTVANLASQGLALVTRDLLGAHGAAVKLQDKLKALKLTALGYGFEKMGSGVFGFLDKSVDASKEYTRQLSLMNAAGMAQKDIAESIASAWSTSREVVTSTAAENLKSIRELRTVLGSQRMGDTFAILPTVQRIKGTLEALTGKAQDDVAFDVVKAVDLRTSGLMSGAALQRNADMMGRTLMAMGGTLNTHDYLMTLKYAKNSALSWSDEFIYDYLPTLMQEVKAGGGGMGSTSTAGTALRALSKVIVGGVIPKSAIPVWEAMGLVKPGDVVRNATGNWQVRPGGVEGAQLAATNPLAWAEKFAPAIEAYSKHHNLNLLQTVTAMSNNSNAQWALYTMLAKAPQFERDRKLIESGGTSLQTYQRLMQTNPQLAEAAMHSQYQNILARLGFEILPRLIPYMVKFADGLDTVSQWMQKHGDLTKNLVIGLGGFSLAMSVLGKVMMTAGIIKFLGMGSTVMAALNPIGLAVVAIASIGTAAYEAYKHWSAIEALWDRLFNHTPWTGSVGHFGGPDDQPWTGSVGHMRSGQANRTTVVHTQVNLDGRAIAIAVSKHQGRSAAKPQTGQSGFDSSMMPIPAGGHGGL